MTIDDQQFTMIPHPTLKWELANQLMLRYVKASMASVVISSHRDMMDEKMVYTVEVSDGMIRSIQPLGWAKYYLIDSLLEQLREKLLKSQ